MSFDESINAYFVTTGTVTDANSPKFKDMELGLTYLRNHITEDHIRQIKASEGFPLIASGQLTKKDVFVFDQFEGDFFQQLLLTKSLIIGPRCLITCLLSCLPIPLGVSPIYTTAMRDLHICASGIAVQEKANVRNLIQWMGGYYFQSLSSQVTHLISNTIKSNKYEHATLRGIPVMHVDWVQRVWERSCVENVSATDDEFKKYRLPIFFGTNITCTGLDAEKKNEVMRLVNENGGTYHAAFRSSLVDIVITERQNTNSDKYKAAVRYKKDVITPEWIFDSVEKGFALPPKGYLVKALKVSTPIRNDRSLADFTQCSDTSHISVMPSGRRGRNEMTTVNETITSGFNDIVPLQQKDNTLKVPVTRGSIAKNLQREFQAKSAAVDHYRQVYEEICPKQAKKAGIFLDGCCIYLSGFRSEEREKLNRILNVGGATRYDVVNEKITHIIVGQLDDAELRTWKRDGILTAVHIVRLDWLLQSIKLKQPASEVVHRMSLTTSDEPNLPSPSSKKTLRSMNHSFKQPDKPKKKLFETETKNSPDSLVKAVVPQPIPTSTEEEEQILIAQYSQENEPIVEVPVPRLSTLVTDPAEHTIAAPVASSTLRPADSQLQQPNANTENSKMTCITNTEIDFDNLDFFEGKSLYIDREHFPEEFYSQMLSECQSAHGNIVPSTFVDIVDYAIVSFERTLNVYDLPVKAQHIVTDLYVENCMKQNKLVPIEYFHRHIPDTANSQPLQGMTIVISTYTALENDFIDSIAQLLGANVNRTLAKKERPLLVCPRPEGSKYVGSIKWGYPIVTSAWLVQCAVEGKKLPYQPYLVGESVSDFPSSPALRERNVMSTPVHTAAAAQLPTPMEVDGNMENNRALVSTPLVSNEFTPLRNKRVSELAGGVGVTPQSLPNTTSDSPHTPTNMYNRPSVNFEYLDGVLAEIEDPEARECLRDLIKEMRNNQTPELERIRRQACTPINRKIPTPKGIPDFCTTPEFQKRMAEAFERRWRLPTKKIKPDTPIDEVRRRVLRTTCEALGIPYSDTEETPSTSTAIKRTNATSANHVTPVGSTNEKTVSGITQPRNSGVIPRAIFNMPTCSQPSRVSDGFVPSTQTPPRAGSIGANNASDIEMPQCASFGGKSTLDFDKISFENTEASASAIGKVTSVANRSETVTKSSPEIQKITEYLKNCETRRQSMKRADNESGSSSGSSGGLPTDNIHGHVVQHMDSEMTDAGSQHYVQPFESEQFGVGTENMVGWRDPVEFGKERRSKVVPTMQFKGTPRFSISCVDEDMRIDIIKKIIQLGGKVSENLINFDPTCTHFICERPNRGEKMLGCVSSGKWVLSLKYIEECYAKDVFVDEELYEWGNSKALNLPQLTQDEQVLAHAVHRWRKLLNNNATLDEPRGAFTNFRVILHIAERNADAVRNVIRAGLGIVLDVQKPYSTCTKVQEATHCFVDIKKAPLDREDYEHLRALGVQIYSQMYINSFLMYGDEVDAAKYVVNM